MVTIEDVAKRAGVSVMTASRVVNQSNLVKKSTAERVLRAIEELGYIQNKLAKSLVSGKSKTIGIISSNYYNQAYTDIVVAISDIAYKNGYAVINANVNDYQSAVRGVNTLLGHQVDGVILLPVEMSMTKVGDYRISMAQIEHFVKYFKQAVTDANIPAITVSQKIDGLIDIGFDFKDLAQKAMDYLFEKGYTDIAMINSNIYDGFWREKEDLYKSMMKERGLEANICIEKDVSEVDGGYRAMKRMLSYRRPRAVFCANDFMAIGALQIINKLKLKVPEDIAVIGNDNVFFSEMTYPKLTTVALNAGDAGDKAIGIMLKLLADKKVSLCDEIIATEVVERESV